MISEILKTNLGEIVKGGPVILHPSIFKDERGFFFESWNKKNFNGLIDEEINFYQDNHSSSTKGVLRGLHYQLLPEPQGKLVRCISGEIFDVAVDIRQKSLTYGQWVGCFLSSQNKNQLWIPVGFAHGFLTISEYAEVLYKASGYWNSSLERSIIWSDPKINIEWPLKKIGIKSPLLADKDKKAPQLIDMENKKEVF